MQMGNRLDLRFINLGFQRMGSNEIYEVSYSLGSSLLIQTVNRLWEWFQAEVFSSNLAWAMRAWCTALYSRFTTQLVMAKFFIDMIHNVNCGPTGSWPQNSPGWTLECSQYHISDHRAASSIRLRDQLSVRLFVELPCPIYSCYDKIFYYPISSFTMNKMIRSGY